MNMKTYLANKALEVLEGQEGKKLYCIPYKESGNVMRYLDKHKADFTHRYNWDYSELIVLL